MWPQYSFTILCVQAPLLETAFSVNEEGHNQKHLNHFARRPIANKRLHLIEYHSQLQAILFNSPLCSLCLWDKAHYIIVVHCVLSVGPLPSCWEWISWAHCPHSTVSLLKDQTLITFTTYVDYWCLCLITSHLIKCPSNVRQLLFNRNRFFKKYFRNKANETQA